MAGKANRAITRFSSPVAFYASLGLLLIGLLVLHFLPSNQVITYAVVFVATSALYLWIARILFIIEIPDKVLSLVLAFSVAVQLSYINLSPVGSDDVYRYMWEGKVQAHGINPYKFAPQDSQLEQLRSPLLPRSVNHPDMKSVYFPFTQWVFSAAYALSAEHVWGIKVILIASHIATLCALVLLLRRLKIATQYALLYALAPLILLQFGLDAHIDIVGFPFLLFGLLFYLDGKKTLSYILIALSISTKPVALLFLPLAFLHEQGWREKSKVVGVPLVVLAGQFLPYVFEANPMEALFTFARHWTFNGVVFEVLNLFFVDNQTTRLVCALLLVAVLLLLYSRRRDLLETFYYSLLLLLLFSPVVHPWYVAWMTLLLPVARRWSGIVLTATASLTVYTVVRYWLEGTWEQSAVILAVEYLPVMMLLFVELRRREGDQTTLIIPKP